jgi:ribosomal protein L37AE/L43A
MDEIEEDAINQCDYRCPACRSSQDLAIRVHIWTALVIDGSDTDGCTPRLQGPAYRHSNPLTVISR